MGVRSIGGHSVFSVDQWFYLQRPMPRRWLRESRKKQGGDDVSVKEEEGDPDHGEEELQ